MSTFRYRVQRYNPTTGAFMGPGPIPRSLEASAPLNDVPAMSVSFGDAQNIVRAPAELAVELSFNDGQSWTEPPNMRFAVMGDSRDRIKSPKFPTLKSVGMFWQLKKAVVLPESGPLDADGRRAWTTITPGALIRTLVQEAQARGVLPWLDVSSFSSTLDSNGASWPVTFSTSHEIGIGYDSIVIALADAGLVDFQMQGRALKVYVADTFLAPSPTSVTLVEGQDFTEATEEVTFELVASRNLIKGDGISTVVVDAAASKPWGEWEVVTSASGSTALADLNALADLGSARSSLFQTQRTYTAYPNATTSTPKPWLDYKVGDQIAAQTDSTLETNLRVRQMTLRGDGSSAQVTLVLGDRLLEREVRIQRLLKANSGGVAAAGGGSSIPSTTTEDTIAPNPPTGIGLASSAVLINGAYVANLTVNWTAPTTNTNGTIFDDFDHYEVQTKRTALGSNYWEAGGTSTLPIITVGGLVPGASYDARVRAVDKSGNFSTWLTGTLTTSMDGAAPNKPSTSTVVPELGILFLYWNGKDEFGNNPPGDFAALKVYMSTTSGFTIGTANYVDSITATTGGRVPIADLVYGTTYFFKTTMVDLAGNESATSVQVSSIPERVTGLDIAALTVDTTNMVDLAISTAKIANLAVLNGKIANLAVDDAKIANMSVGKLTVGTLSADITVSARIKTSNTGARVELNSSGLQAYNSSNVLTVNIDSATGDALFTGIFKTGLSGQRIEIDSTGYGTIYFFPPTGSDYSFINAPSQNSIGVNSGDGGTGFRTRFYTLPGYAEMVYMTTGQVTAGGRVEVNNSGVWLSGLSGDVIDLSVGSGATFQLSTAAYLTGNSYLAVTTNNGVALYGSNNNRYLQFDGGGGTALNSGGGNLTIGSSGAQLTVDAGNSRYLSLNPSGDSQLLNGSSNITLTGSTVELWGSAHKLINLASGSVGNNVIINNHQVYNNTSSREIKTNIDDVTNRDALVAGFMKLRPVVFNDKNDYAERGEESPRILGMIAEEVLEIDALGELLGWKVGVTGNQYPSIAWFHVVTAAVIAIQNLNDRIDTLETQAAS